MKYVLLLLCCASFLSARELPIKKGSEQYFDSGALKRIKLTEPTEIQGMPCMRWTWFYEDGSLRRFQASRDFELNGIPIPLRSTVFLRGDGTPECIWLYRDTEIQGYTCPGSSWSKPATGFYANGNLRYFFPGKPLIIQGFPVKPGGLAGVYFYESGKLRQFFLDKDKEVDGVLYKKGLRLTIDEQGRVIETYKKSFWEKYFPMFF